MFAQRVLDAKGQEWTVEKRYTPWRRLLRPIALFTGSYPDHSLTWPEAQPAEASPREPRRLGVTAATVVLIPLLAVESIGMVLAAILMFPLLALELALLGIAGMCLGLVRAAGLARQRVDVTCWTGHHLHSETVLLMHGRRRARQLVEQVAAERSAAPRSFEPSKLPADVTVRSHRSIWQAPDKWIPKTTSPSDSTNKQIMKTRLVILTAGACAILLVVSILEYYFE